MRSLIPNPWHYRIYVFGLLVLVVGMPLSKFLMSLAQFILMANWLLAGNPLEKLKQFFANKAALVFSSIILLHLIGLLYTANFTYGFEDVRKKAPFLFLPILLSTSPALKKEHFKFLLGMVVVAVGLSCVISLGLLKGWWSSKKIVYPIVDVRQVFIFISHIRLGLLIVMCCCILFYFAIDTKRKGSWLLCLLGLFIFAFFLLKLELMTALVVLVVVAVVLLFYFLLRSSFKGKYIIFLSFLTVFTGGIIYAFVWVKQSLNAPRPAIDFDHLDKQTHQGEFYSHDTTSFVVENGNYVFLYVADQELEKEWNRRSKMSFSGKDLKGNDLKYTILRFLTSKGLRKDADGVAMLSSQEIEAIEQGVPNVEYLHVSAVKRRLLQLRWELQTYRSGNTPNGHSLTQRFEYWKTAGHIIKNHFLIGVGTGDVKDSFLKQYNDEHSMLDKQWRLRSHNQFLSIFVGFGVLGLIWFLIVIFFPAFYSGKFYDYLFLSFFSIAILSFLTEDTLETQAGATFFTFFYSFFVFQRTVDKEKGADFFLPKE